MSVRSPSAALVLPLLPLLPVLSVLAATLLAAGAARAETAMVSVGPATWRPLYPPSPAEETVAVPAFRLDVTPVTNADFLEFVTAHPEWRRDRVAGILADSEYLSHWAAADELGEDAGPRQPVTRVSWFAAEAYCDARGARLPRVAEWEVAAAASREKLDAAGDAEHRQRILAWYSQPSPHRLRDVGTEAPNAWGAHDLHGLTWEWVEDFNSELVSADNRENGGADRLRFCGASALSAKDKEDYAAFMRVAFRSSLEGRYTTRNLGFRCASDLETP